MNNRRKLLVALGAGTLTVPFASSAQQQAAKIPRIGIVEFGGPPDSQFVSDYINALRLLGYAEPSSLQVERRYAQGKAERFADLLQDLANKRVDLVFVVGNDIANVAKRVTPTLPVVTAGSEDPVMSGLIESFRRPGDNITGVTYLSPQLAAKRLELLKEIGYIASRDAVGPYPRRYLLRRNGICRTFARRATAIG
jgi:putative tryptophan/tyrosine transport system substrate-binding protein